MAVVVPVAFTLTTGIFGALNTIGGIFISMRKCYKGYKKIGGLLEESEVSVTSTKNLAK